MESAELSSASSWLHWLSIVKYVGGAMVVLGVAAELLGDWFSEPLQKKLDDARKLEIVQLTTEGKRLAKEAEVARASIAEANARAANAEKETAELQNLSMKLRMDRGHFISRTATKQALLGKPTGRAEVLWLKGGPDGKWLADGIAFSLLGDVPGAGWKIERVAPIDELPTEARPTDVTVIGKKGGKFMFGRFPNPPEANELMDIVGTALMKGLDSSIIELNFGIDPSLPDDLVRVVIGAKR